ncbi:MAG: NUDIX hydrolase [Candidatus Nomurabacteria bacterium]|nr:NUDIX hydrolase [Candidatus Nomurabacteria bacterium]
MIITDRDHPERGVLKETWQITSGGIRRERNQEPSGHIENESPEKALRRELEEELGLKVGDYDYHPGSVTIENQESRSFPGLPCSYEIHKFDVFPHPGTKVICDNFIETTEPDGTVSHFEWIPIPQVG